MVRQLFHKECVDGSIPSVTTKHKEIKMKELTFELLLDKYRKEVANTFTVGGNIDYWRNKSNETYERLIKRYHDKNLSM